MIATASKIRPLVKTHGGKAYLARRIIAHFPPHRTYVEPFAGGLSVLLNKPPATVEVASDLNGDLVNLYRMLQSSPVELVARLDALDYCRETFDTTATGLAGCAIESAVRFLVRNRMSRGGLGKTFAWSDRLRGGRPGDLNAWETIKAQLPVVAVRLRGVEIRQSPALDVIQEHDGPETLHYCDPPYLPSTRTAPNAYRHEMTRYEHAELLDVLAACRGTVVLSGYPPPFYEARLAGWDRVTFDMPNHSGQGQSKQRRTEAVWIKPA